MNPNFLLHSTREQEHMQLFFLGLVSLHWSDYLKFHACYHRWRLAFLLWLSSIQFCPCISLHQLVAVTSAVCILWLLWIINNTLSACPSRSQADRSHGSSKLMFWENSIYHNGHIDLLCQNSHIQATEYEWKNKDIKVISVSSRTTK